jgi:hypothetical protein
MHCKMIDWYMRSRSALASSWFQFSSSTSQLRLQSRLFLVIHSQRRQRYTLCPPRFLMRRRETSYGPLREELVVFSLIITWSRNETKRTLWPTSQGRPHVCSRGLGLVSVDVHGGDLDTQFCVLLPEGTVGQWPFLFLLLLLLLLWLWLWFWLWL